MLSQGPCGLSSVSVDLGRKDISWGPTGEVTLLGELFGSFLLGSISWASPLRLKIFSLLSVTGSDSGVIDPISFTDSRERSWFFKDGFYPLIEHSPIAFGNSPSFTVPSSPGTGAFLSTLCHYLFQEGYSLFRSCALGTTRLCTWYYSRVHPAPLIACISSATHHPTTREPTAKTLPWKKVEWVDEWGLYVKSPYVNPKSKCTDSFL